MRFENGDAELRFAQDNLHAPVKPKQRLTHNAEYLPLYLLNTRVDLYRTKVASTLDGEESEYTYFIDLLEFRNPKFHIPLNFYETKHQDLRTSSGVGVSAVCLHPLDEVLKACDEGEAHNIYFGNMLRQLVLSTLGEDWGGTHIVFQAEQESYCEYAKRNQKQKKKSWFERLIDRD